MASSFGFLSDVEIIQTQGRIKKHESSTRAPYFARLESKVVAR